MQLPTLSLHTQVTLRRLHQIAYCTTTLQHHITNEAPTVLLMKLLLCYNRYTRMELTIHHDESRSSVISHHQLLAVPSSNISHQPSVISHQSSVISHQSSVISHRSSDINCWLRHRTSAVGHSLPYFNVPISLRREYPIITVSRLLPRHLRPALSRANCSSQRLDYRF